MYFIYITNSTFPSVNFGPIYTSHFTIKRSIGEMISAFNKTSNKTLDNNQSRKSVLANISEKNG